MGINEIYDLLKSTGNIDVPRKRKSRIARWYEQFDDEVENLPEVPEGKLEQLWFLSNARYMCLGLGEWLCSIVMPWLLLF